MQGAGDQFLAGPALSGQDHRAVRVGGLFDQIEHRQDRRTLADQIIVLCL